MSLLNIVSRIEEERQLNRTLLSSLLGKLDADIARLEEQKIHIAEEFHERDASLARLIDGGTLPEPIIPQKEPEPQAEEAA